MHKIIDFPFYSGFTSHLLFSSLFSAEIELHEQIKRVIEILFENVYCCTFQTYISFTVVALYVARAEYDGKVG